MHYKENLSLSVYVSACYKCILNYLDVLCDLSQALPDEERHLAGVQHMEVFPQFGVSLISAPLLLVQGAVLQEAVTQHLELGHGVEIGDGSDGALALVLGVHRLLACMGKRVTEGEMK